MDEKTLIKAIELQLGRRDVKPEDRLYEDLGAESIDMLHIVTHIESLTGINIPEEMIPEFRTIQDLFQYIQNRET